MVAVPKLVFAAKDTLTSVKAYAADGVKTAAAHAVVVGENCAVPPTPESTPPGALVVSMSTTDEPTTCGAAVGIADGVPVRDTVEVRVPVSDAVGEREGVAELVGGGVALGEVPKVGEGVGDGVGDVDGGTAV